MRKLILIVIVLSFFAMASNCRRRGGDAVTVAMPEQFTTLDTLTTVKSDAAAERVRTLIFNSLVRKDANFDYVGELASDIKTTEDGKTITFTLREGVKFHNGTVLTSADVKYTLDQLLQSNGYKAGGFFDTAPDTSINVDSNAPKTEPKNANASVGAVVKVKTKKVPYMDGAVETPDPKTVVIKVVRPSFRNKILSNLVAIPIIPEGTIGQQKETPLGSGPFKFVNLDTSQNILELSGNAEYWDSAPKVQKMRLKVLPDASSLQAELQAGTVDLAPNPSNLPPDMINSMGQSVNLKVDKFDGSNIQYLLFNTKEGPLANVQIRQAIGYAIDRKKIVSDLLLNQVRIADAVLPPESWAFSPGTQYTYDPAKAQQLLQEAGYNNEPIVFKYRAGGAATSQYSQVIQSSLAEIGMNIQIETLDGPTLTQQLGLGQFQMYTGIWVGGNTDTIFLRDLFSSAKIPIPELVSCCNRGRYVNSEVDKLIDDAENTTDKATAKALYTKTWNMISNDLPMLPLWYPANIVVSNKRIGNIKMSGSGDWVFLKDITAQ
ncbi:MAG: ABC transporter substrate-binding protein [Chloracidobacterium sp.]|nr:ABC transporter substrate-binding protein [Chloracidobacterium sp.]